MKYFKIFGLMASLVAGFFLATAVLPYTLSAQNPILPDSLTGEIDSSTDGEFHRKTFRPLAIDSPVRDAKHVVLGETTEEKRIEVDLTNQRLSAFEGNRKVYDFLVSTGKWGRTPTGEFHIWIKLRYTRMSGGNKALGTYYNLPNVPYTMYFYNSDIPMQRGYGIHGAYWHNNFGHPMSHGCINMKPEEAGILYAWADPVIPDGKSSVRAGDSNPGTRIIIYGKAPQT